MKRAYFILALLQGAMLAWSIAAPQPGFSDAKWQALNFTGDISRERRMFFTGGCDSCHQDPRPARSLAAWRRSQA